MKPAKIRAVIGGTGLYTPPHAIDNLELVDAFNAWVDLENERNRKAIEAGTMEPMAYSSVEFIEKASGIKSRYVVDKEGILDPTRMVPRLPERSNEEPGYLCEMGVAAAREAITQSGRKASEIDFVIVACSNLERAYPAVSVEIQNELGIDGFAFDMNVACSSATFGIQAGCDAVTSGSARAVLVINPEICTGHLNFRDRDSHFIFGDAATAVLIEDADHSHAKEQWLIRGTRLKTVFSNHIRNNFGFLNRGDEAGRDEPDKLFVQHGRKVFKEVVPVVSDLISDHLAELGIEPQQLTRAWLHQANLNMNLLIAKKIFGKDPDPRDVPIILDEYANTSSAGSVIAFHKHRDGLSVGDLGILCSFGAGYSVGNVVLERTV
jgi:beta-ketodecanoyl-[acyl-carrier-protein] synthase